MSKFKNAEELVASLVKAIRERRLLSVACEGMTRVIEPYLIYQSQGGSLLLHGWQVSGHFRTTPPPDWCNLKLEEMTEAVALDQRYERPRKGYNPSSSQFHKILVSAPPILVLQSSAAKSS